MPLQVIFWYLLWLPWKLYFILTNKKLRWSTPINVNMLKTCQRTLSTSSLDKVKQSSRQRALTASIRMLKLTGCVVSKRCWIYITKTKSSQLTYTAEINWKSWPQWDLNLHLAFGAIWTWIWTPCGLNSSIGRVADQYPEGVSSNPTWVNFFS